MISKEQYFDIAVAHRKEHKCGAYPYENGNFLTRITSELKPENILEIGTGIGYSAYCLALGNETSHIDTIDMLLEHGEISLKYWTKNGLENRIDSIVGNSTEILKQLVINERNYDLIFFDGFTPNPDEVNDFVKLLNSDGLLITTNLTLASEIFRVDEYLQNIADEGLNTKIFEDTSFSSRNQTTIEIAQKIWNEA